MPGKVDVNLGYLLELPDEITPTENPYYSNSFWNLYWFYFRVFPPLSNKAR